MTERLYKKYGTDHGIIITDVKRFSNADNQGLRPGYVITEVDNKEIDSVKDFEDIVDSKKGKAILLKVRVDKKNSFFVGLEIPEE